MKISRRTPFRLAAATLAMTQIFTAAASAAFTNGFSWSYPVGEGLTYTRTEGKNSAGVQRANVLTYAPNTGSYRQINDCLILRCWLPYIKNCITYFQCIFRFCSGKTFRAVFKLEISLCFISQFFQKLGTIDSNFQDLFF